MLTKKTSLSWRYFFLIVLLGGLPASLMCYPHVTTTQGRVLDTQKTTSTHIEFMDGSQRRVWDMQDSGWLEDFEPVANDGDDENWLRRVEAGETEATYTKIGWSKEAVR